MGRKTSRERGRESEFDSFMKKDWERIACSSLLANRVISKTRETGRVVTELLVGPS